MLILVGCAVESAKNAEKTVDRKENSRHSTDYSATTQSVSYKTKIKILPNSPAETVRVFYQKLREQKIQEAMFLTNLRPAIEGLTDVELKDLQVDFAPLARQVPADVAINGEIVSGKFATVTAQLPDNETDKVGLQEIRLRQDNGVWIILTVDEAAEAKVKAEKNHYFTALRIETHQQEAKAMLNRIDKAQMVFSMQNNGLYADIPALIDKGFLPADIQTSQSTGYSYKISLSDDKRKFLAAAEPALYGKTGKLSFWFQVNGSRSSTLNRRDTKGQPLKNTDNL